MRIKKTEHIYLSDKEEQLWVDFVDLLNAIQRETEHHEIDVLISEIEEKLFDLSEFTEVE